MASSPRYLELLTEAADRAENGIETNDRNGLWNLFDKQWDVLTNHPDDLEQLTWFSATGLALLRSLTSTSIPRLASDAIALHANKNSGYAGRGNPDPWANFRLAQAFGVRPFTGVLIRLSDKYIRTVNLRRDPENERVGEAITETIRDAIAYPLIARCIAEESLS